MLNEHKGVYSTTRREVKPCSEAGERRAARSAVPRSPAEDTIITLSTHCSAQSDLHSSYFRSFSFRQSTFYISTLYVSQTVKKTGYPIQIGHTYFYKSPHPQPHCVNRRKQSWVGHSPCVTTSAGIRNVSFTKKRYIPPLRLHRCRLGIDPQWSPIQVFFNK